MSMISYHRLLIIIGCLLITVPSWGQERPLLADVEIQKIFIDANREKLLEHYEDAAFLFREVLKKDPQNHSAAYELARTYEVLDKDAQALQSIEKAVKLSPNNIWYKDFYAIVLDKNNKSEKAAQVYGELAKSYPENEYFLFNQAMHYVKANLPQKAVVIYDKLEKKMGINEDITKKKYTLYYGMGDNKAAVAELEKLIKTFPSEISYLHILADFHSKEGNTSDAKKVYKRILELDADDPEAGMAMADTYKKGGDHKQYLSSIRSIINKTDVNIDIKVKELFPYITMLKSTKDQEMKMAALDLGELLTQVHPQEAKAHSLYADMLYHAGQPKEALSYYEKTLKLDKRVFAVWEQMMYLKMELNDIEGIIKTSEQAMDIFPNQAKVYYLNGLAQSVKEDHREAVNMFEQALMMSGKNTALKYDLSNRLGTEYANLKKFERSDKMFERALELSPNGHSALYNYSYQLVKRNENLQQARQMAFKATQIKEDQPLFLANLGHVHFKLKNYQEAQNWLEKSMKVGGEQYPEILELFADVLEKNGNKSRAAEYREKSKALKAL